VGLVLLHLLKEGAQEEEGMGAEVEGLGLVLGLGLGLVLVLVLVLVLWLLWRSSQSVGGTVRMSCRARPVI